MTRRLAAAGLLCVLAAAALAPAHADVPPPLKQMASGVPLGEIRCSGDMVLMQNDGRPACVTPHTADILQQRGWGHVPPSTGGTSAGGPDAGGLHGQRPTQVVVDAGDIESPVIPPGIAAANNAFAADFYRQLSADPEEDGRNLFFSPMSMYTAFSMLYEGARHDTAAQMQDVFGFKPDAEARHNSTAHLVASLNRDDPHATLSMANALWIADWFEPHDSYVDIARGTYLADAEKVDFLDDSEGGGVKRINGWADEKTHGKIREVITPEDVDALTAMVINNAIYFKGTWVTQFPAEDTRQSRFWTNNTHSADTDFMHVTGVFNHTVSDGVQVLKMPYRGDRLSMLVVLPEGRDGIGALEDAVSADMIERWRQGLHPGEVAVSMPKFEMETNYDLRDHLFYLGMTDAFDVYDADLLGILGIQPGEEYVGRNLYVSKATQDAYVKVNEEGTEAAAVTTIIVGVESVPPPPPRFTADHPFLFMIQDDESGAVLFMGRVYDPTA